MTVEAILMVLSTQYVQVFVDGAMVKSSELFSEEQSLVELKVWHRRLVSPIHTSSGFLPPLFWIVHIYCNLMSWCSHWCWRNTSCVHMTHDKNLLSACDLPVTFGGLM